MAPGILPGRLTIFCARDTKHLDRVWQSRVRELETYTAEGDHIALIEQPYVSSLARDMSACLAKASAACVLAGEKKGRVSPSSPPLSRHRRSLALRSVHGYILHGFVTISLFSVKLVPFQ